MPIRLLRSALLATVLSLAGHTALAAESVIQVFKDANCGCCGKWVDHLREQGFKVEVSNVADVSAERRRLRMPEELASCHVGKVGDYTIEGHVPASDIHKLLRTRPRAAGIAVPGMPPTSPGMDLKVDSHYDTLLMQADGKTRIFARH